MPAPLEFGTAFHVGMETFWNPETWKLSDKELYILARDAFVRECESQRARYLANVEQYLLDPEVAADYDERIDMGKGMLRKLIKTLDRQQYTPVAVEEEAFVAIRNPWTGLQLNCKCQRCYDKWAASGLFDDFSTPEDFNGLPVYYGIRPDALLQDLEGGYWIVDWKSAAQLLKDQITLELDNQVSNYCWVLMYVARLDIRGFQYVQIYKGYPKTPEVLVAPRLGRAFSVKKGQRTDYQTYKRYVSQHDREAFEAGLYDEYLEWLKAGGPKFINWFKIFKTPQQLEIIGKDLFLQIEDFINGQGRYYPTSSKILCQSCYFQEPCLERQSGGDFMEILQEQYTKQEIYYILERERRNK